MEDINIFEGLSTNDMTTQATGFISDLSPYSALIIGIILAMIILTYIISSIKAEKNEDDEDDDDDLFDY